MNSTSTSIFSPPYPPSYTEQLQDLVFISNKRKIPVVFHEWKSDEYSKDKKARFTILFCGGNCEDLGQVELWCQILKETLHVNVVTFDYTGFGLHQGNPSERNCYEDTACVFRWIVNEKKIIPEEILILGKGIGSGPAVHLAARMFKGYKKKTHRKIKSLERFDFLGFEGESIPEGRIAGLILMSPITSVLKLAKDNNEAVPRISIDMFDNISKAKNVECPVFIMHAKNDEVFPIRHSEALAKEFPKCKFIQLEDLFEEEDDFLDALVDFIDSLSGVKMTRPSFSIPKDSVYGLSPSILVARWLQEIEQENYLDVLLSNGYFDLEAVCTLEKDDLEALDIVGEDQETILRHIEEYKKSGKDKQTSSPISVPLMHGEIKEKRSTTRNEEHQFVKKQFTHPVWCKCCTKFIYGVFYQGYWCKQCGYTVHQRCLDITPDNCPRRMVKRSSFQKLKSVSENIFKSSSPKSGKR